MEPLSTIEIICTSAGALIVSFGFGWQIQQGRIEGVKEDIDRLKAKYGEQAETLQKLADENKSLPELKSTIDARKREYEEKEKQLLAAIEKAKVEGNEKDKKILNEALKTLSVAVDKMRELQEEVNELKPYKDEVERQKTKQRIAETLSQIRLSDSSALTGFIDAKSLSTYSIPLGSLPMYQLPSLYDTLMPCPSCPLSPSQCLKCARKYCNIHMPKGSLGVGANLTCGNCLDPLKISLEN